MFGLIFFLGWKHHRRLLAEGYHRAENRRQGAKKVDQEFVESVESEWEEKLFGPEALTRQGN